MFHLVLWAGWGPEGGYLYSRTLTLKGEGSGTSFCPPFPIVRIWPSDIRRVQEVPYCIPNHGTETYCPPYLPGLRQNKNTTLSPKAGLYWGHGRSASRFKWGLSYRKKSNPGRSSALSQSARVLEESSFWVFNSGRPSFMACGQSLKEDLTQFAFV